MLKRHPLHLASKLSWCLTNIFLINFKRILKEILFKRMNVYKEEYETLYPSRCGSVSRKVFYSKGKTLETLFKCYYFFHSSSGGGILQSLRSDWVRERAAFSHPTRLRFELSRFAKHVLFAWKHFKLTLPLREKKMSQSSLSL